jgi:dynein heavy chain
LLCETRDPNLVQGFLHLCFAGIQSLEFDDLQEGYAMISAKGERIPFLSPLRTKDAKGCVEKWMMQVYFSEFFISIIFTLTKSFDCPPAF